MKSIILTLTISFFLMGCDFDQIRKARISAGVRAHSDKLMVEIEARKEILRKTHSKEKKPSQKQAEEYVWEYINRNFVDPDSVKRLKILAVSETNEYWAICFEANAKNRMGGYNGIERYSLGINNNRAYSNGTAMCWVQKACGLQDKCAGG